MNQLSFIYYEKRFVYNLAILLIWTLGNLIKLNINENRDKFIDWNIDHINPCFFHLKCGTVCFCTEEYCIFEQPISS